MNAIAHKRLAFGALALALAGTIPAAAQPVATPPANPFAGPTGGNRYEMPAAAVAPPVALALKAAQAVAAACKQYQLGIAVVNVKGEPVLVYLPDNSPGNHSFMAFRKAYTAAAFGQDTSAVLAGIGADPTIAARFAADPVMIRFKGGLVLRRKGQVVGAIGVSGAEPGGHDEECGKTGLAAIEADMNR